MWGQKNINGDRYWCSFATSLPQARATDPTCSGCLQLEGCSLKSTRRSFLDTYVQGGQRDFEIV